jgi:hypothetical protein
VPDSLQPLGTVGASGRLDSEYDSTTIFKKRVPMFGTVARYSRTIAGVREVGTPSWQCRDSQREDRACAFPKSRAVGGIVTPWRELRSAYPKSPHC